MQLLGIDGPQRVLVDMALFYRLVGTAWGEVGAPSTLMVYSMRWMFRLSLDWMDVSSIQSNR